MYRILAVDDNDLNLGLFKLFLDQLGHSITAVNNPIEALELSRQGAFDLIFTDIQMPEMSGIEASKKFREYGHTGPIVAITAHLSEAEQTKLLNSEINDVLIKPVTKPELDELLDRWLYQYEKFETFAVRTEAPKYQTNHPIFDDRLALERANGSPEIAREMLGLLIESLEETKAQLEKPTDLETLKNIVHKFGGGVRFSGSRRVETELDKLHAILHSESPSQDKEALLESIVQLLEWLENHPDLFT